MNEKNIELTMSIRKNARETLKRLRTEEKEGKIQSNVVKVSFYSFFLSFLNINKII